MAYPVLKSKYPWESVYHTLLKGLTNLLGQPFSSVSTLLGLVPVFQDLLQPLFRHAGHIILSQKLIPALLWKTQLEDVF